MSNHKTKIPLEELVILPCGHRAALYWVQGYELTQLHVLDFNFDERHALGGNRWLIAFIKENDTAIHDFLKEEQSRREAYIYRAKIEDDGRLTRFPDIVLPSYILNQALAIKEDVLYLGGFQVKWEGKKRWSKVNQGELAGYFNLRLDEPVWHSLSIPIDIQPGKSIDDVLVYDDKLVLVDNIMFPKYLFEYDVSEPLAPVVTKTIDLPNNGTYEHIHRGSINSNWMALLSSGVGREGSAQYVSVFGLPNYEQVLTVYLLDSSDDFWERDRFTTLEKELELARSTVRLYDFAIAGDHVLIACGHHGIGVFPLMALLEEFREEQRRAEAELKQNKRAFRCRNGRSYSLSRIYDDSKYLRKIEQLEEVHKLVPLPDGRVVAIGYGETHRKLEYKVLRFLTLHTKELSE